VAFTVSLLLLSGSIVTIAIQVSSDNEWESNCGTKVATPEPAGGPMSYENAGCHLEERQLTAWCMSVQGLGIQ
jgi:hypothetical protein